MTQRLPELVEIRKQLQTKLNEMGVSPEHYEEVMELLTQYRSGDLEIARGSQFHDTAFEILVQLNAISNANKKTDKLSLLLRQFAVHVAQNVVRASPDDTIEEMIDSIPEMIEEE